MPEPPVGGEDLRAWHAGWRTNRGYPPARGSEVLRVEIGAPGRSVEHLVLDADAHPRRIDAAAGAALERPDSWVAVPTADPGRVVDRLREHRLRIRSDSELLMTVSIARHEAALPPSYAAELEVEEREGIPLLRARVRTHDGEVAATGDAAVVGDLAVPDRIETAPGHRRRGLGAAVMSRLTAAALEAGGRRGLLVASEEGQRLYRSLGWTGRQRLVIGVNE